MTIAKCMGRPVLVEVNMFPMSMLTRTFFTQNSFIHITSSRSCSLHRFFINNRAIIKILIRIPKSLDSNNGISFNSNYNSKYINTFTITNTAFTAYLFFMGVTLPPRSLLIKRTNVYGGKRKNSYCHP